MEFWAQIHEDGLHPLRNSDSEQLSKLKLHNEYKFVVTQPRNVGHHRKFFALINMAYDNQEKFNSVDDFRAWCTIKAGYYRRIETPGNDLYLPESISFASMDQTKFEEFYYKFMDVICNFLDTSRDEIIENIVNYI